MQNVRIEYQLPVAWLIIDRPKALNAIIAHSRGWSAEDMERNVSEVKHSRELREGAQELVARAAAMARLMVEGGVPEHPLVRGGRKAHQLDSEPTG